MATRFRSEVERWRSNLAAERDALALYQALVRVEKEPARAQIWRELAAIEERHASRWLDKLRAAGEEVRDEWRPGWRPRALGWLAALLGPSAVLPLVTALGRGDADLYMDQPDAQDLVREEEHMGRVVSAIAEGRPAEAVAREAALPPGSEHAEAEQIESDARPRSATAQAGVLPGPASPDRGRERWHKGTSGRSGALRAAVFGVNDGLVSNLSLVMGVAGADPGNQFVLLAGVAGLLAGSFSMAAGEYVSMQSQRELFERQIALERDELAEDPEEEQQELALIYRAKGVSRSEAEQLARSLMSDPEIALDTLIREELGLDPDELGSPWAAATSSFASFAVGALLPVLPYLFFGSFGAFVLSAVLSAVALFAVGAAVSLLTGRGLLYSGARMLLIGAAAAAVTYVVGHLIGISVAG